MRLTAQPNRMRTIAMMVVLFFGLQSGRFFLTATLGPLFCPEDFRQGAALATNHHADHEAAEHARHSAGDAGYYFEHCKDTYPGMALTPAQPMPVPSQAPQVELPSSYAAVIPVTLYVADRAVAPILPPPRFSQSA
jgi:hypothetical protein